MNARLSLCHLVLATAALGACSSSDTSPSNGGSSGSTSGNTGGASPISGGGGASGLGGAVGGSGGAAGSGGATGGASGSTSDGGAAGSGGATGGAAGQLGGSGGVATDGGDAAAGASGGTGGSDGGPTPVNGQCIFWPTASQRKAPEFTLPAPTNPTGIILRLMNNCPVDLWVSGVNLPAVQLAARQAGQPPVENVYDWAGGGGRISAHTKSATGFEVGFIEFNAQKGKGLNVDNSYVDWLGLPIEVRGNDPKTCLTSCYHPYATLFDECPTQLSDQNNKICWAPKQWCINNKTDPICTKIVAAAVAAGQADPKCNRGADTADNIYGCAGKWNDAYCCAEVTRGYKTDINDPNGNGTKNCNYYKEQPYSDYSAYSHKVCPMIYSFAYDDYNNQSGIQQCPGVTEMDVTYCPGDP